MENKKINIAELLKNCPRGMELDCVMFNNVTLLEVEEGAQFPISIKVGIDDTYLLTEYGEWNDGDVNAKCIIFPKGKTTWEGFVPPCEFKDGDILSYQLKGFENRSIYIYKQHSRLNTSYYVALNCVSELLMASEDGYALNGYDDSVRLATEEEKQKLFKEIEKNGYRWNFHAKRLEKLIEPKFKVGDKVRKKGDSKYHIIEDECTTFYTLNSIGHIDFTDQDEWELVPDNKFDISTLQPYISKVMTQEDKDLLLKDLSARLPYGVKCYGFQQKIDGNDNECYGTLKSISNIDSGWKFILNNRVPLNNKKCYEESYHIVKPYLFPLSSMTEEQEVEYNSYFEKIPYCDYGMHLPSYFLELLIDFYNKNHLDWRGLIPMGLAIDATGLNIY